jgi:kynureninase
VSAAPRLLDERRALDLDQSDPLGGLRERFLVPAAGSGPHAEVAYLAGNSLGLQPRATGERIAEELADWARLGVEGHTEAARPWVSYHGLLREPAARLVGARPSEVVMMNSLTVNLHLMMVSFYRPTQQRRAVLVEDSTFPSDSYAVRSQVAFHGYDPDVDVVRLKPREGENVLRSEDVVGYLDKHGASAALVLLGAVNYLSGEFLDIKSITAAGHRAGAVVGWDLAHAAGNVPLRLHEWDVDWAAWCTYKYLNSGPGAVAGAFVHERHLRDTDRPRLAGWWSTEPATRFEMRSTLDPVYTADAWAVSNPPILAMAPALLSLEMFDEVGIDVLRGRSLALTGYLEAVLDEVCPGRPLEVITPRDPNRRGAQLSVRVRGIDAAEVSRVLREDYEVIADFRRPDVIRLAPAPFYVSYHDCWRAALSLADLMDRHG